MTPTTRSRIHPRRTLQGVGPRDVAAPTPRVKARAAAARGGRRTRISGQLLADRYRVEALLGEGTTANVYRGRDRLIDRPVAIKIIRPELMGVRWLVDAFLCEARAAAKVDHDNVVRVFDFGRTDGKVWVVFELLEGQTLDQRIAGEGAMPWPTVLRIMRQLCRALVAAHEAGIVHRDVKPHNCVCIDREGQTDFIKVVDFGIAELQTTGTDVKIVAGTPSYMAPETVRGAGDHRADVYSAGVVMYELLTGTCPYGGSTPRAILEQHAWGEVIAPTARVPRPESISAAVDHVVLRAIAKDPADRFQTMRDFAEAIEMAASGMLDAIVPTRAPRAHGVPTAAAPPEPQPGVQTEPRRQHRSGLVGWGLVAAAIVGGVVALGSGRVDLDAAMLRAGIGHAPVGERTPISVDEALRTTADGGAEAASAH